MPRFEMEISLPVSADLLAAELLTMAGVNYELGPYLKMSAPRDWYTRPIREWPTGSMIFTSRVLFMGFLPVDLHHFKLLAVERMGFRECSQSLLNRAWMHGRLISTRGAGAVVKDVVSYESKFRWLGKLFMPVYKAVFAHRHRRLKSKYARSG